MTAKEILAELKPLGSDSTRSALPFPLPFPVAERSFSFLFAVLFFFVLFAIVLTSFRVCLV